MRTYLGLGGILVLLVSIALGFGVLWREWQATALDEKRKGYGIIDDSFPPLCVWEVDPPERVMTENRSQAIVVRATNPTDRECQDTLAFRAPGFDVSPSKEELKIAIPPRNSGSYSWILSPRKTGTYQVSVSDVLNTRIMGIDVTDVYGLSPAQARVLSTAGGLFGPMLTVPWWIERFGRRKQKGSPPRKDPPPEPAATEPPA